ncbi:MAG TPA: AAA family ATPase [Acidimicrobiales bacterium]
MGVTSWPLVGRGSELAAARGALAEPGGGVVVAGRPGVGRTRLADEILAELEAEGATVVRLVATRAAATIPFWAAAPLLGHPARRTGAGETGVDATGATGAPGTGRGAPETGGAPGTDSTGGDGAGSAPARPLDAADALVSAHRAVAELAAVAPVVVGVDDVHLLDEATAGLLSQVVDAGQVRLVLTLRSDDTPPPAVARLLEGRGWPRLELDDLGRDDVAAVLAGALEGGEVESATVDRLWEATQGNPLFLRELCRDALEAGTLARHHGVWTWSAAPFTGPRLHDLVAERLGQLSPDEHTLAGLLALGEPLPAELAERLTSPLVVAALRDRGLVTVEVIDGRTVVRLSHPLYADGIRARLGPLETTDLYASLVEGMLKDLDELDADDRLRLAVWSVSGHADLDPAVLVAAAEDARRRDDPALAERLVRAALGLRHSGPRREPPAPPAPPVRGDRTLLAAYRALGEALADQQRFEEAEAVLAPLAALATDDAERARIALARLAATRLDPDHLDDARAIVAGTEIRDPVHRDTVLAGLAGVLSHAGAIQEGGELALRLAEESDDVVRLRALTPASAWLIHAGRTEQAIDLAGRLFEVACAHTEDVPDGRGWAVAAGATALLTSGRACDVEAVLQAAMDDPERRRDQAASAVSLLNGRTALARGRPATARRYLREAVLALERTDTHGRHHWALAALAEAEALLGDGDAAAATLADPPTGRESMRYRRDAERARLWVTAAQGDVTGAIRQAIDRADDARAAGHIGFELLFLEVALRLGSVGVADRLAAVAARVEGPLAAALGRLADAAAANDGARLDAVADEFAALGMDLHAAETAMRAARAHRAAGASSWARESQARAEAWRDRCEGARTPALTAPGGRGPAELTRREREVAVLAAKGLSSRAIAERLDVSVRTVDNQLGRAYRKLGISGRAELPSVAAALGLEP